MSSGIAAEIITLLDQERDYLIASDLDALENLSSSKEALAQKLASGNVEFEKSVVEGIRTKSLHNSNLFESSLLGIRSALDRLEEVRFTFGQLKTYNGQGQISTESTRNPTISKKA